jgi:YD repeat-containing protein
LRRLGVKLKDPVGRVTSTVSPDTGTTAYSYHPDGTLATKTDAIGTVVTYAYDSASRLAQISFPNASENVTYSYDSASVSFGKGRLTGMVSSDIILYDVREHELLRPCLG